VRLAACEHLPQETFLITLEVIHLAHIVDVGTRGTRAIYVQ
jgi:hypothetical protein